MTFYSKFILPVVVILTVLSPCAGCGHIQYLDKYDSYVASVEYESSVRVGILCPDGEVGMGTGFIIDSSHVLTAKHVVEACGDVEPAQIVVRTTDGVIITVAVDKKSDTVDVARLKVVGDAPFSIYAVVDVRKPRIGEELCTVGGDSVPVDGIKKCGFLQNYESVVSNYGVSIPIVPGNSGGPVYDSMGHVVGLIVTWRGNMSREPLGGFIPSIKFLDML